MLRSPECVKFSTSVEGCLFSLFASQRTLACGNDIVRPWMLCMFDFGD